METLRKLISEVFIHQAVIGADICGECSLQEPFEDFLQDSKINHMTNKILYRFISAKIEFEEYFPVMRKLSLEQQKKIKESVVEKTVKKGTVVYGEASECTGLLVVYSGMLRAYSLSEEGREITLYRLFERDVCLFSASCMLSGIQFEITIEAEKDTKLWMIPAKIWRELMEESAVLANYTNELMADRFTNVMWLIEQIMWKSFDKRLAEFLLEEIQVEGTKTLKLTHEVIGNHLGTAREVVTRMLRYFQQEGWVKLSRGTVEVARPERAGRCSRFQKIIKNRSTVWRERLCFLPFLNHFQYLFLWFCSGRPADHFAVFKYGQCGNAQNAELHSQIFLLVDIDLADFDVTAFFCNFIYQRKNHLAGTATSWPRNQLKRVFQSLILPVRNYLY